jgi:hypothetical protein
MFIGNITVELSPKAPTRDTFSDLPNLGHDAYWFAKQIRDLKWTSKDGVEVTMSDYYDVVGVHVCSRCSRPP